jgi:hypothetical protein
VCAMEGGVLLWASSHHIFDKETQAYHRVPVGLRQPNARARDAINVGRQDVAVSRETYVAPTQVVRKNEQDVRLTETSQGQPGCSHTQSKPPINFRPPGTKRTPTRTPTRARKSTQHETQQTRSMPYLTAAWATHTSPAASRASMLSVSICLWSL